MIVSHQVEGTRLSACSRHILDLDGRIRMSLYEVGELLRATIKDKGDI